MANLASEQLTERQRALLRGVVEEHITTGQPVGSRTLLARTGLRISSSTARAELAELERLEPSPGAFPLDLSAAKAEVESALQATTEMLSEVTRLLALVSAPPLESATIRHVEVLRLQPQVVMIVVITSTGAVTKRVYAFVEPVDPGLAKWAGQYLNDALAGLQPGTHQLRQRLEDPGLSEREAAFIGILRPTFIELADEGQSLYVGGTAGLLEGAREDELDVYQRLLEMLEKRAALLGVVSQALDPRRPFVRVGVDLDHPDLQRLSLVGAAYGLANRTLGAVSLLGPGRMDYEKALRSVRGAATELSRFVEEIYEQN